ncbi:MAG: alpha/beta hydrolase [Planctomycetota bacterium]
MGPRLERPVWRDQTARDRLEDWYHRFQSRISVPTESREIPTRYGPNHVLIAGPDDAPPLVCLHAMRTGSAFIMSELGPLLDRYRVIAPDLPGQSVRGLQKRLSLTDDSHAKWLLDLLDELQLDCPPVFGVSWGGFIARQMATVFPERINRLALLVPAGIVSGSHWVGLIRIAIPMLRYRLRPSPSNLRRLLDPLFTTWDDDWGQFMGDAFRDMPFDFRLPPLATDQELSELAMPVLVLAAADDISFPGDSLYQRMQALVPDCRGEVIPDCKHCPPATPEFRDWLADQLTTFLSDN